MDNNQVEIRSKDGAHRLSDAAPSTTTLSVRWKNNVSALLCFACGACFILSLICTCLATLVVLLDQAVEATSRYGENTREKCVARLHNLNFLNAASSDHLIASLVSHVTIDKFKRVIDMYSQLCSLGCFEQQKDFFLCSSRASLGLFVRSNHCSLLSHSKR